MGVIYDPNPWKDQFLPGIFCYTAIDSELKSEFLTPMSWDVRNRTACDKSA